MRVMNQRPAVRWAPVFDNPRVRDGLDLDNSANGLPGCCGRVVKFWSRVEAVNLAIWVVALVVFSRRGTNYTTRTSCDRRDFLVSAF